MGASMINDDDAGREERRQTRRAGSAADADFTCTLHRAQARSHEFLVAHWCSLRPLRPPSPPPPGLLPVASCSSLRLRSSRPVREVSARSIPAPGQFRSLAAPVATHHFSPASSLVESACRSVGECTQIGVRETDRRVGDGWRPAGGRRLSPVAPRFPRVCSRAAVHTGRQKHAGRTRRTAKTNEDGDTRLTTVLTA